MRPLENTRTREKEKEITWGSMSNFLRCSYSSSSIHCCYLFVVVIVVIIILIIIIVCQDDF